MSTESFPTFKRWLTTLEWRPRSPWRIGPWWGGETRAAQRQTLLQMLALAARERLPYAPLVGELAEDHRWRYRWRLAKLAAYLHVGTPLADAVEQVPGILSPEQTLAVRFGSESGALPAVLSTMAQQHTPPGQGGVARLRHLGRYLVGLLIVVAIVAMFLLTRLLPSVHLIFRDYSLPRPWATRLLSDLVAWVSSYWYLGVVATLALGWMLLSESGWRYTHRVWLPRLSRIAGRLRGAEVLQLLAIAQQAGRPLSAGLSTLARYHYDARVRSQLLFVRNEVEQGAEPWGAMQQSTLLMPAEARALQTAPDQPALIWTLRRLSQLRRERAEQRLQTLAALMHPLAVLLLAAVVLLVAMGVLAPLFSLTTIPA